MSVMGDATSVAATSTAEAFLQKRKKTNRTHCAADYLLNSHTTGLGE